MKNYASLGEALQDMTVTAVDKALNVTEVAYPQDELKTTIQDEAQAAADKSIDVVDVGNDVFAAVKRGANETIYTLSKSGTEIQSLQDKFSAMSPVGQAVAIAGAIFAAKTVAKIVPTPVLLGAFGLFLFTNKK